MRRAGKICSPTGMLDLVVMQNQPRISVIIAVFNAQPTLQKCLDSVAQQNYKNIETIVIDGGSSDGSVSILQQNDLLIDYWISEPDRGVYHAWNKALQQANGEWICFLGADDHLWHQDVLINMMDRLKVHSPDIQIAYGQVMLLTPSADPIYPIGQSWPDLGRQLKRWMCIPHPGAMHRKSFFDVYGYFDETYRIAGDYELLLRGFAAGNAKAVFIPDIITVGMRLGGLSSNPRNSLRVVQEMRRAQKKYEQRWADLIWVLAVVRICARLCLWGLMGEKAGKKGADLARRIKGLPNYWSKV
jgi:glycosyltransferase involved in cell wall biosynthesis